MFDALPVAALEELLRQLLAGCDVKTASDEWGTYITSESARDLAEFIAGDLLEAISLRAVQDG